MHGDLSVSCVQAVMVATLQSKLDESTSRADNLQSQVASLQVRVCTLCYDDPLLTIYFGIVLGLVKGQ